MRITDEELIYIWKYFSYCCLPSLIMSRYAYLDYIDDIRKEKTFYRHELKQTINKLGKTLESLPNKLMDAGAKNIKYMNILGDCIEEQFEKEKEELHRAIYISFRNAKFQHLDCFAAIHYISVMTQIAAVTFTQCCEDFKAVAGIDIGELFHVYNLKGFTESWSGIADKAAETFGYVRKRKKDEEVNLNNLRVSKAIQAIRSKYSDIETLRKAMREAYPWSPNFKEGVPFEQSEDYLIVYSNQNKES